MSFNWGMLSERATVNERIAFIGYTVLGYVALVLHNTVFAPDLSEDPTTLRAILVFLNLGLGTWCFLRALRGLWKVETNR